MLSVILIWLNIGLPIVGLCAAVVGLAATFQRESRVTERTFEALDLRDLLSDSSSATEVRLAGKEASAESPASPLRPAATS